MRLLGKQGENFLVEEAVCINGRWLKEAWEDLKWTVCAEGLGCSHRKAAHSLRRGIQLQFYATPYITHRILSI